jgi:hypothetical protein
MFLLGLKPPWVADLEHHLVSEFLHQSGESGVSSSLCGPESAASMRSAHARAAGVRVH